jgi:ribose transport system permease protein
VLIILMTTFAAINPDFISPANLAVIARGMALVGIVTVGMALCMIGGMVDISVGSTAGLSGTMFVMSLAIWQLPGVVSIAIALLVGAGFGLLNCTLILRGKMNPFIVTIATMFMARGLTSFVTGGRTIYPLPAGWSEFGNAQPIGLSWVFIIFFGLAILAQVALSSLWGLQLRAVGSDREIAVCTEVDATKITYQSFIVIGLLAGLAGALGSMRFNGAQPLLGQGWEFQALAACAIGGVSIYGYDGSLVGAFLGLATMQVLANGLVAVGLSPYLQVVAIGIALCLAMMVDARRRISLDLDVI